MCGGRHQLFLFSASGTLLAESGGMEKCVTGVSVLDSRGLMAAERLSSAAWRGGVDHGGAEGRSAGMARLCGDQRRRQHHRRLDRLAFTLEKAAAMCGDGSVDSPCLSG